MQLYSTFGYGGAPCLPVSSATFMGMEPALDSTALPLALAQRGVQAAGWARLWEKRDAIQHHS